MRPWSQPLLWPHPSGAVTKLYYEATFANMPSSGSWGVGIANSSFVLSSSPASSLTAIQFLSTGNSTCFINASLVYNLGASVSGDIVCVAVDTANKRIWFRRNAGNWNNSGTANPATNTGGFDITYLGSPIFALATTQGFTTPSITANFGASAFSFTIPSGFNPVASATWNPADKSSNITLSGGNLIVSATDTADGGIRSLGWS
jgi:hypothetical protein